MTLKLLLWLDQALEVMLGRKPYVRRSQLDRWQSHGPYCPRCGTKHSDHFSRNGTRPRTLHLLDYTLPLRLPRVKCQCGGSVKLDFGGLLRPYQRLADEVDEQIQRWAALGISLRQMQRELGEFYIGPLGLRTLLQRIHQLKDLTPTLTSQSVPPVLQIDAIWITQLRPNGKVKRDTKGRRREVKGRVKRPLLVALGIWPDEGRSEILAWQLGKNEGTEAWLEFLSELEEAGVRGENGLELILHDGGTGLCGALLTEHFGAAQQRCLFHKLRNIAKALQLPEGLTYKERRRRSRAILKNFQAIWEAKRYQTALRRYLRVVRKYRRSQPKAVATLRRDFRATLAYYRIEREHPGWERRHLRTTSHLERFNRCLRRRFRSAGAYHSDTGILSVMAQETQAWGR